MSDTDHPIAGWYPDPQGSGQHRWWDGTQWTTQFQPASAGFVAPSSAQGGSNKTLVILGYVFAILFWIVGLVIGIVAWTRPEPATRRHGPFIVGVSVLAALGSYAYYKHNHH